MADLVWLASYPKSGNTWLRALLANWAANADQPMGINEMNSTPIASSRMWFDEWAGVESSQLDEETIANLRPAVYRHMGRAARERLALKVHDRWSRTPAGEPMFPTEETAGVIYIIRNPLDVVASLASHLGTGREVAAKTLCGQRPDFDGAVQGLTDQLYQDVGTWSSHATSWIDESGLPVHVLRYEDLRADTIGQFGEVLRFLGEAIDPARVAKAVEFSSFRELQRQEQAGGFKERLGVATEPFFRAGRSGGWREELTPELVAMVLAAHAPLLRRFGYLDEHGQLT